MTTSQAQTVEGREGNATISSNIHTAITKGKKTGFKLTHPKLLPSPWQKLQLSSKDVRSQREINESCPILNFPPEITTEIFMATFPENSFSSWGSTTPLLFGAVCHSWREIAWSYPPLWSSVSLIVQHYTRTKNNILREWFARSGDLPLSIQFHMRKPPSKVKMMEKIKVVVSPTMDIIACCSERWQNIDLRIFAMYYHKLYFVQTQLPLLVSMSISTHTERVWNEWDNLPKIIWNAPKLRHVHLSPGLERYLVLPLDQTVTFSWLGSSSSYYQCLKILEDTPNLAKYQFTCIYRTWYEPLPNVIVLKLKTLELTFRNGFWMEEIFNNLTIPALLELSLDILIGNPAQAFPYAAFTLFISRSGCHLMRFSLSNFVFPESQLADCLLAVPLLTDLRLEKIAITSETLRNLSVGQLSQRILLPHLENFTYVHEGYRWDYTDYSTLSLMAASRWDHDTRISSEPVQLKSIYVKLSEVGARFNIIENSFYTYDEGSDELKRTASNERTAATFKRLIAEGMDIQIMG